MTLNLTSTQILAGIGVLIVWSVVWRLGARKARRAADAARASARVVSLVGRVLLMGAAFVGVQWLVITHPGNPTLLAVVLAVPDLIAAHVLTRALTVTSLDTTSRRGGGRR
ncbi:MULTISPECIES: hypothetical protein [unclassified Amycolatopsis]|uniref:hypothetical protein n=1 Tax=unclassified Amycolatopsis TaxID=2618356 RepID=UPI00106E3CCE|nr:MULTISPECIES: hypothetical protein [unclassified Amycolatopsis]